ncbi:11-beta-hydroxysteroid dehydrogenase 1-like [Halichondria panicea]|uniref:11-beta-hydroxysteroid dehydrogenase 1-like n=1 Tax=Halichondria panicea TaxID=6063 RepID=UPI00312B85D2
MYVLVIGAACTLTLKNRMGWRKILAVGLLIGVAAVAWEWKSSVNIEEFYKGKRVVLTGASKGIGKSLAIQLSKRGAKLVIAARTVQKLADTQSECLKNTPHVHTVRADVSKEEDCRAIVDKAVEEFGGVDILILNAAYSPNPQWFSDYEKPAEKFSSVLGVNLLQSVQLVHFSLSHLNKSQGIIVPVSSGAGIAAIPKVSAYATSKHALHGYFKALNQEFILTNTPVSITIMPLPYVLTETAVTNWKPIGTGDGITAEDCADRMLHGIPKRQLWYYVDWTLWFMGHVYSLYPEFFDVFTRLHLSRTSYLFS